jgi:hypothetical protein
MNGLNYIFVAALVKLSLFADETPTPQCVLSANFGGNSLLPLIMLLRNLLVFGSARVPDVQACVCDWACTSFTQKMTSRGGALVFYCTATCSSSLQLFHPTARQESFNK